MFRSDTQNSGFLSKLTTRPAPKVSQSLQNLKSCSTDPSYLQSNFSNDSKIEIEDLKQKNSEQKIKNQPIREFERNTHNSNFTIVPNSDSHSEWVLGKNLFDEKSMMMREVKEEVDRVFEESTTKYSQNTKRRQESLLKKLFKKRIVQFAITSDMPEKKQRLAKVANAIILAARKMKDSGITLDDLMSGKKKL